MADARFFQVSGPVSLAELAKLTGAAPEGDGARMLHDVAPLDVAGPQEVSFFDNVKYLDAFCATKAGACFVRPKFVSRAPAGMALLVTEEPYYAYAQVAQLFYPERTVTAGISPAAHIAGSAALGDGVRVDAGAIIGERVKIGTRCHIGANSVIGDGVEIGDDSRIGALCSLSHCVLGRGVVLHRGVHIGQDGFGFAPSKRGVLKVPQLGRVIIGDGVDIGSGTCIDRGAGPDTTIGMHTKIDNLVQIGHNVQIGKFVFIAAQVGLAGSAKVGDFVMLGGQCGVSGHIALGDGVKIIAQSGVMHDLASGGTYGGSPAIPAREWHRQTLTVAKLSKKDSTD